eukprot:scaffold132447_cov33-Tisochrysis_lutea.AAC.4
MAEACSASGTVLAANSSRGRMDAPAVEGSDANEDTPGLTFIEPPGTAHTLGGTELSAERSYLHKGDMEREGLDAIDGEGRLLVIFLDVASCTLSIAHLYTWTLVPVEPASKMTA